MRPLMTPWLALITINALAASASPAEFEMIQLERRYLECNRAASTQRLSSGSAAACSVIAQRLLTQRFGGDFERLLQWSRSAPDPSDGTADSFEAAQMHYEAGRYNAAYALFARLADCGHRTAARIALQMHKFGSKLYGLEFAAHAQQLVRWQVVASANPHDGSRGCSTA